MTTITFAGDESGDVSFAFGKGASKLFAIAMIATDDAEGMRALMTGIALENRLVDGFEFKFHRLTSTRLRKSVFDRLNQGSFEAWCLLVDKTRLPDSFKLLKGIDFYLYFVTESIRYIPENKQSGATLILDEFGGTKTTSSAVRRMMKIRGITKNFRRIEARDSRNEPLIQVADLIAGAVTHRDSVKGSEVYERIVGKLNQEVNYP